MCPLSVHDHTQLAAESYKLMKQRITTKIWNNSRQATSGVSEWERLGWVCSPYLVWTKQTFEIKCQDLPSLVHSEESSPFKSCTITVYTEDSHNMWVYAPSPQGALLNVSHQFCANPIIRHRDEVQTPHFPPPEIFSGISMTPASQHNVTMWPATMFSCTKTLSANSLLTEVNCDERKTCVVKNINWHGVPA